MKKLVTFLLALVASISMMAQVTTSNISGKITDTGKGPLPGATVVATHVPSGTQYYAVADANGWADQYMTIADFNAYAEAQRHVSEVYKDKYRFNRMSLINIAKAGYFSSDRSIREYCNNIWNL